MPHIIIEYPEADITENVVAEILSALHASVVNSGLFKNSHIRTRACPFRDYTHGEDNKPYIHIQARIKSGRNAFAKKMLSRTMLEGFPAWVYRSR